MEVEMGRLPKPLTDFPISWWDAAIHTIDAKPWTLWMARLFGRRFTGHDGEFEVIGYQWRGKLYFHDFRDNG